MAVKQTDIPPQEKKQPLEDADQDYGDEFERSISSGKSKIECICPGCGKMHVMKLRWIGRGVPRKFCQRCRERETPLDDED